MFIRLWSTGFYGGVLAPQLLIEFLFEVVLPVIGIVLELVNWKFARWVNVGCFKCATVHFDYFSNAVAGKLLWSRQTGIKWRGAL
jgi:hypothetical protein